MNKFGITGLTALSALALCLGTAPKANATLIVSYNVTGGSGGGTSGSCSDGAACDTFAASPGMLGVNAFTDAGVTITGSFSSSTKGPPTDILSTATTSIFNNSNAAATVTITVGDTSFTAPVSTVSLAGSGTFTGTGSSATLNYYGDTANGQSTAYNVTPGTMLDTAGFTASGSVSAFALNNPPVAFSASNPFSLTEQLVVTLAPGASLTSHGQTATASVNSVSVPEPISLAMLGTGLVSVGALRLRRRRS